MPTVKVLSKAGARKLNIVNTRTYEQT